MRIDLANPTLAELLLHEVEGATNASLSRKFNISSQHCHNTLTGLLEEGLVKRSKAKTYRCTPKGDKLRVWLWGKP